MYLSLPLPINHKYADCMYIFSNLSFGQNYMKVCSHPTCNVSMKYHTVFHHHFTFLLGTWFPLPVSKKRNNQSRLNQAKVHIKKKYYGLITEHLQLKPMTSDCLQHTKIHYCVHKRLSLDPMWARWIQSTASHPILQYPFWCYANI